MTRSRDACWITDVDPKQLAECESDHRMVVFTVQPRRGEGAHVRRGLRAARRARTAAPHRVDRLREEGKPAELAAATAEAVAALPSAAEPERSLEDSERQLVAALRTATDAVL